MLGWNHERVHFPSCLLARRQHCYGRSLLHLMVLQCQLLACTREVARTGLVLHMLLVVATSLSGIQILGVVVVRLSRSWISWRRLDGLPDERCHRVVRNLRFLMLRDNERSGSLRLGLLLHAQSVSCPHLILFDFLFFFNRLLAPIKRWHVS